MKRLLYALVVFILGSSIAFAQVPQAFKYQAIVRDANGEVIANNNITLRINIIKNNTEGEIIYSELHSTQTTGLGLVNLSIGKGEAPTSNFSAIDWGSGNHFIQIELDPSGANNFIQMGTTELLSVPYALYALTSGDGEGSNRGGGNLWDDDKSTDNIYNTNSGNVGVGTATPDELLHVAGSVKIEDGTQGSGKVLSSDANGVASWVDPGALISETDPVFSVSTAGGITAVEVTNWNESYGWGDHSLAGYITSESDPVFGLSPAFSISNSDISNWNTAYGWGDHALAGYLTSENDPVFAASPAFNIVALDIVNWNSAFAWGDHSLAGYLTSESDPVFGLSPAFGIAGADITNWNTSFGWGDHAAVGYLTTESDPVFSASDAFGIAALDILNWDEAYGWGDHSLEGYLTTELDPVFGLSPAFGIAAGDITNWNSAYGWGDHAAAGYLTV